MCQPVVLRPRVFWFGFILKEEEALGGGNLPSSGLFFEIKMISFRYSILSDPFQGVSHVTTFAGEGR